jgi:hypothetical protein
MLGKDKQKKKYERKGEEMSANRKGITGMSQLS